MLNFVALGLASYLLTGRSAARGGRADVTTQEIPRVRLVPSLNGIFEALGLANPPRAALRLPDRRLVVGVVVCVLLNRTRFGFDLRASGLSASAAVASGVDARGMVVKTMLLSGAIAGLIGLPDLLGVTHAYTTNFTAGLGFLGHRGGAARPQPARSASRWPRCCSPSSTVARCRCRSPTSRRRW